MVEQSGGEGSSYNLVYTGELFHSTEEEGDEESEDGYRWGGWDNSEDKSEADEEELDDAYEQDWVRDLPPISTPTLRMLIMNLPSRPLLSGYATH